MKMSNKQIAEIVGVVAVVLSLLFLTFEIRQSNKIATASAEGETREWAREVRTRIAENPEFASLMLKLRDAGSELSPSDEERAYAYAVQYIAVWSQTNAAFENGVLSEYSFNINSTDIGVNMTRYPGLVKFYAEAAKDYKFVPGTSRMWDVLLDELSQRGYEIN